MKCPHCQAANAETMYQGSIWCRFCGKQITAMLPSLGSNKDG